MNRITAIMLSIWPWSVISAQTKTDTLYLSAEYRTVSREQAVYYRIRTLDADSLWRFDDYFMNGRCLQQVHYTSPTGVIREGETVSYDTCGHRVLAGNYHMGFKTGIWTEYFDHSPRIRERREYTPGSGYSMTTCDSLSGSVLRKGYFDAQDLKTGIWTEYFFRSGQVRSIQRFIAGRREGEQSEYFFNGQLKRKEFYRNGRQTSSKQYSETGKRVRYYPSYTYARPPVSLRKVLYAKVPCFESALKLQDIHIRCIVQKDGTLQQVEIRSAADEDCRLRMAMALYKMKAWRPAMKEKMPVQSEYECTIRFYKRTGD
ncbi:MAG: hypothetical protein JNJ58_09165 [Chitinophagaceae bacterium]|nr:hypothetical protein [Chitinophagaceae bacterium]